MSATGESKPGVKEDVWIPSACSMCYADCSILAHRVDGVVVKIEGNPKSPIGNGRLCPKGVSSLWVLYDPNRVNKPLKRTNPEKGIEVDPKWVEITWEEALDAIAERLGKIRAEDPRKLMVQTTTTRATSNAHSTWAFEAAFGTPNMWVAGGGLHCGNGPHHLAGWTHSSWDVIPDYKYCNLVFYFGSTSGHGAGHVANTTAQQAADARARGMKAVTFDPLCNPVAAKATEWVPILPGTDTALALSICNLLVNELGVYDAKHLKNHTNAGYLTKGDGYYIRDKATNKPLLWDLNDSKAKPYDDPSLKDPALLGDYQVEGVPCQPAFQRLKEHLRKYTPEHAQEISTVPAATIRRLARMWGEEARVGSTIVLEGHELPYRPVAAVFFRGSAGHRNSAHICASLDLLNQLVGAADVPGGCLGFNPRCLGYPGTGKLAYEPTESLDGMLAAGGWWLREGPYPPPDPAPPVRMGLQDLFPLAMLPPTPASADQEELWTKVGLPYRIEMMINVGANSVMSVGNKDIVAQALKRIPFIVDFAIFLTEFDDFADIVLPDSCFLERYDPAPNKPQIFNHPAGLGEWGWPIRQPVVEAKEERRSVSDIFMELGYRLGMGDEMNMAYEIVLQFDQANRVKPKEKYTWAQICDRMLKSYFGPEHGLDWFKEHGVMTWTKKVEEVYWRPFIRARVPIYYEIWQRIGEQEKKLCDQYGIKYDWAPYKPLLDWFPCHSHTEPNPEYDLFAFYYRDVLHTNSFTMENPWLDEASRMSPYTYNITINVETGRKKGLKDGDEVWMESAKGRKVKGRVKLSQGAHPQALGVAACAGHWTPHQPIARGKGVFFNDLLELDLDHSDPITQNLDLCVKVKVYKA